MDAARHHGLRPTGVGCALGRSSRPLAQPLDVSRLREVENGENGEPGHGGEPGVGADFLNDFRQGSEL